MEKVPDKSPNTAEYIEVVKSDVRDEGNSVVFEFQFAARVSPDKMQSLSWNSEGTVQKTVVEELSKKGWVSVDGTKKLVPFGNNGKPSPDGKTWTVRFYRQNPDAPSSPR